jgi:phosphoenolpyruvate-protein phosphotransferase (PTS system enzyme I)
MELRGIAASSGIGIGNAVCIREQSLDYSNVGYAGKDAEKQRLHAAVEQFNEATQTLSERIRSDVGEHEAEILTGQITMLADPFLRSQMDDAIDAGNCAEAAADQVCTMYADMFAGVEDEMMRQRAADVRDIRTRLLSILLGVKQVDVSMLPKGCVLCANELTASMTVGLQADSVSAIVTEVGGSTSHSAILARAMGIPAVLSVPKLLEQVQDGSCLIVDGNDGHVFLNPDERTRNEYLKRQERENEHKRLLQTYQNQPTVDADGKRFQLYANIGSPAEAQFAADNGAEGIGLFRTEFLYMDRTSAPTETEQFEAYQAVSDCMVGKEVIIRTLDVGGDKAIDYLGMAKEENPFLGHRAIRYCLDRLEFYKIQLRALLRAGAKNHNIKIMLPLVTELEEVRSARNLLEQCKQELSQEGLDYDKNIALGIMIETPAAAWTADLLARECDFFSIGTNDLTQYTMAVDRGNAQVAALYTPFHPAVLRSIRNVISAGKAANIPVGMCGEAAADPRLIPLLMQWGLDEFSVSASSVLSTRAQIKCWRSRETALVEEEAMKLSTASGVQGYLEATKKTI